MGSSHLAAAVYNVGGKFIRKPFLELDEEDFESGWVANGRGSYHFSQAVLPLLLDHVKDCQYPPTLIFTSATAASKSNLHDPP